MDRSLTDTGEPPTYRSYLLRLWREGLAGEPWRASLQSAVTGERQGFASLDDLFGFIRSQVEAAPDQYQDAGQMAASQRR
jgi:hypothetical protein